MSSPPRLYPTNLSDAEWTILEPLIPPAKPGGRDRKWSMRLIMDGIFYVVRSGCQWRLLPTDFPPWQTVYHYFRLFRIDGTWKELNSALRERERGRLGRNPQPSAAIIDSQYPFRAQSVKATSVGGIRGYDGAKKLSGRKRHVLVDVNGLVLRAAVHAADMQDRASVSLVLDGAHVDFPQIELIWADQGYTGGGKTWIEEQLGWRVEIVQHAPRSRGKWTIVPDADDPTMGHFEWIRFPPAKKEFRGVLPRRWVAERTFSWFGQSRRLAKEYERLCETSQAMIYATMTRLMLKRLACA